MREKEQSKTVDIEELRRVRITKRNIKDRERREQVFSRNREQGSLKEGEQHPHITTHLPSHQMSKHFLVVSSTCTADN